MSKKRLMGGGREGESYQSESARPYASAAAVAARVSQQLQPTCSLPAIALPCPHPQPAILRPSLNPTQGAIRGTRCGTQIFHFGSDGATPKSCRGDAYSQFHSRHSRTCCPTCRINFVSDGDRIQVPTRPRDFQVLTVRSEHRWARWSSRGRMIASPRVYEACLTIKQNQPHAYLHRRARIRLRCCRAFPVHPASGALSAQRDAPGARAMPPRSGSVAHSLVSCTVFLVLEPDS